MKNDLDTWRKIHIAFYLGMIVRDLSWCTMTQPSQDANDFAGLQHSLEKFDLLALGDSMDATISAVIARVQRAGLAVQEDEVRLFAEDMARYFRV